MPKDQRVETKATIVRVEKMNLATAHGIRISLPSANFVWIQKVYTVCVQIFEASKHFAKTIFADHEFRVYGILKFRELNFRGLVGIRENRENYAPRKFGRIW